uniref:Uncharacterized protein n=1 Tax=Pyxicephalus adspersus TaxID=30357 RepID=A0AAV3AXC3_PYXAD|nr:TPA: hypothetical protein GDO54_000397 [Pyxicephalus adspersus]
MFFEAWSLQKKSIHTFVAASDSFVGLLDAGIPHHVLWCYTQTPIPVQDPVVTADVEIQWELGIQHTWNSVFSTYKSTTKQ